MRYLSVCSGIEAATVAWHDLGWKPEAFSEIEKFPSQVLNYHYPDVPTTRLQQALEAALMDKFIQEWLKPLAYGAGFALVMALLLFWGIK